jgi:hypothetical protein
MTETKTATVTIISIWSKWDDAEGKLRGRDKNVVYDVQVPCDNRTDELDTLEAAFRITNLDDRPLARQACASTCGDVFVLNGQHWLVDKSGFTPLTQAQADKVLALSSRDTGMGYSWLVEHKLIPTWC